MRSAVVVLLVAVVAPALPAKLPPYLKFCKRNDPKLNDCALKNTRDALPSIIKGDKNFGIPVLDPLIIEKIVVGDGKQGSLGITFSCNKCKITGLKNLQINAVKFDLNNKRLELAGKLPKVEVKGKYTASGKVFILPIQGDGDTELKLIDVNLGYKADYELKKGKDGKEYLQLKKPKLTIKANGFNIKLTNLFKGDKALGNQMNAFLNENWRDVLKEFGPAVAESISKIATTVVNGISSKVPLDQILV